MGRFTPDHLPSDWTFEKVGRSYRVFDEKGIQRCGAKRGKGKAGTICRAKPKGDNLRCHDHQLPLQKGADNPMFKHGRYSRYMPVDLRARYEELQRDPEFASLDANISILDVRLSELLERIGDGDLLGAYLPLRRLYVKAERALKDKDTELFSETWQRIGKLISEGADNHQLWREIINTNEERGKMTKRREDIALAKDRALSLPDLMALIADIVDAFNGTADIPHTEDRKRAFSERIERLIERKESDVLG